jgi:hypothetical protein
MALGGAVDAFRGTAGEAARELVLWTTRDGREIPLDDMSDDHIANAIRVLSLWKQRLRKRVCNDPVIEELKLAIVRFKEIERRRRKAASRIAPKATRSGRSQSAGDKLAKERFAKHGSGTDDCANDQLGKAGRPKVKSAYSSFGSRGVRPRKPDANT